MSCKPLTKKEWQASLAEMWEAAVESTYKDLIAQAVLDEREACAKLFDDRDNGVGFYEPHEPAEIIRARGKA
jgi:hypothetical protein